MRNSGGRAATRGAARGQRAALITIAAGALFAAVSGPASAEPLRGGGSPQARAAVAPLSGSAGTHATGVTYTPTTVVIPPSTVAADLVSVSGDGGTYTFRSTAGPLSQLKKGSVMLLSGYAVRNVLGVRAKGAGLVVSTRPAAITDLIENGTLSWSKTPSFAHAYAYSGSSVPPEQARDVGAHAARDGGPQASVASRFGLTATDGRPITLKGKTHSYGFGITFRPGRKSVGVDITITKSSPVEMSATISGTLNNVSSSGTIKVAHRQLASARMAANGLSGEFKLAYSLKPISQFGLGTAGGVKITLPGEITVPFVVGGIPFYFGIKVAFIASVGFSGFDQEVKGDYTIHYDGHGGFSTSSSGATSASGALSSLGKILLDAANAVRNGPLSVILGAQVPQLELGLGVKGLNVGGFVNVIAVTGVKTYGSGCDARGLQIQGNAGAEANFFGFSAPLGSVKLFERQIGASYPRGCGTFNGF